MFLKLLTPTIVVPSRSAWCPDPRSARNPYKEDHVCSWDEEEEPEESEEEKRVLKELRQLVVLNYTKRHYGLPALWAPTRGDYGVYCTSSDSFT